MTDDLDRLEALARAATPGPWEQGDVWQWASVMPSQYGEGRCVLCDSYGEPVWIGKADINGKVMLAHKHRNGDPWNVDHFISAEDGLVAGPYDYDTGGIMRAEDCAYIAAVSPDVVLGLIERLRGASKPSWPYCARCGEGEDAVSCEGCGTVGCDVCIPRWVCDECKKAGLG